MSTSSNKDQYVVIIGDIIDSKKITNRNEVQHKLKKVLQDINRNYANDIVAKFIISLGDEFQGLIKNQGNILKITFDIERELTPVKLRFGVGIGSVNTDIDFDNSLEIDGPAYYRARKMIQMIEDKKSQYTENDSNIMVCFGDGKSDGEEVINAMLGVCGAIKSRWTKRQNEIINAYLTNGLNQYKTAKFLGIAQSSVNRALKSAKFYSYLVAMNKLEAFLKREGGESGV